MYDHRPSVIALSDLQDAALAAARLAGGERPAAEPVVSVSASFIDPALGPVILGYTAPPVLFRHDPLTF